MLPRRFAARYAPAIVYIVVEEVGHDHMIHVKMQLTVDKR